MRVFSYDNATQRAGPVDHQTFRGRGVVAAGAGVEGSVATIGTRDVMMTDTIRKPHLVVVNGGAGKAQRAEPAKIMNEARGKALVAALARQTVRRACFDAHRQVDEIGRIYLVCYLCGHRIDPARERWEAEHTLRKTLNGSDDPINVWPAHATCPKSKTAKDIAENSKGKRSATAISASGAVADSSSRRALNSIGDSGAMCGAKNDHQDWPGHGHFHLAPSARRHRERPAHCAPCGPTDPAPLAELLRTCAFFCCGAETEGDLKACARRFRNLAILAEGLAREIEKEQP